MAWDEPRRREWADPRDLIAHLVALAARHSDVDALNLGAQAIRRQTVNWRPSTPTCCPAATP